MIFVLFEMFPVFPSKSYRQVICAPESLKNTAYMSAVRDCYTSLLRSIPLNIFAIWTPTNAISTHDSRFHDSTRSIFLISPEVSSRFIPLRQFVSQICPKPGQIHFPNPKPPLRIYPAIVHGHAFSALAFYQFLQHCHFSCFLIQQCNPLPVSANITSYDIFPETNHGDGIKGYFEDASYSYCVSCCRSMARMWIVQGLAYTSTQ